MIHTDSGASILHGFSKSFKTHFAKTNGLGFSSTDAAFSFAIFIASTCLSVNGGSPLHIHTMAFTEATVILIAIVASYAPNGSLGNGARDPQR